MMGINAKEAQHTLVGVASTAFLWHIWVAVSKFFGHPKEVVKNSFKDVL